MRISRERNRRRVPAEACLISLTPILTKKKSALTSTFSRFFLRRARRARSRSGRASERRHNPPEPPPARDDCAASPKLFFFLGELSPCLRMGFLGVVPRLRRSLPRRAKRGNRARGFLFAYPYFRYAPRGNAADSFSANEKSVPAGTAPTGTLFAFGEKEDYFFFFPVDLKSFFTDATA